MNSKFKIILIVLAVSAIGFASVFGGEEKNVEEKSEKVDKYDDSDKSSNSKLSSIKLAKGKGKNKDIKTSDPVVKKTQNTKTNSKSASKKSGDEKKIAKADIKIKKPPKRSLQLSDSFIITDNTKANSFRINSKKNWGRFNDKIYISYDLFGQKDDSRKTRLKKNRLEFNYKLFVSSFSKKEPFVEYSYSSDKPTQLTWKVLSGGLARTLPFGIKAGLGYGYKWGTLTNKEQYKYDVVTLDLNKTKKISKITFKQNFKNITPRKMEDSKQPIYDYKSSISTPFAKNVNGTLNFDWRYQKVPELKKEDWFNYSVKFGLTFSPIK